MLKMAENRSIEKKSHNPSNLEVLDENISVVLPFTGVKLPLYLLL